ncbi:guanine nucleotide-binding protein-like 3-like protein isoform X3 [Calonectris borealis]|uniref:guanine nucleotide-binding protein-like 3-like protein isoform X3 n=1 Tax=Calonectris borealis TaxID=1323832 RepID=UPI003F4B0E93
MTRSRRQVEAARRKRVQGKHAKAAGKKDPGVLQLSRFAAHVQQQNEKRQKRAAEAQRRREEARETEVGRRRSLAGLQQEALRRQREFERKEVAAAATQPDAQEEASLRQYGRELRKVLAASDVVLEVLDARDPQGCRSPQLEAAVRRAGHRQRLVLVLNKIDLVPRDVVAAWLKYLRGEFPTVAFKACTQQQSRNLKQSRLPVATVPDDVLAGGACVGADCLLRVLANYSRSGEVKTTITVGVVGYPNVGKSSLINSLKRSRACGVGAAPGVTRCLQAVQLDRHIQLLDCPGVVMATGAPPAAAPLRGALAPQRLRDPLSPAAAILRRCPPEQVGPPRGGGAAVGTEAERALRGPPLRRPPTVPVPPGPATGPAPSRGAAGPPRRRRGPAARLDQREDLLLHPPPRNAGGAAGGPNPDGAGAGTRLGGAGEGRRRGAGSHTGDSDGHRAVPVCPRGGGRGGEIRRGGRNSHGG